MSIERFEQLEVWQVAHQIVLDVYKGTMHLPPEEKFGLTSQMRGRQSPYQPILPKASKGEARPTRSVFTILRRVRLKSSGTTHFSATTLVFRWSRIIFRSESIKPAGC